MTRKTLTWRVLFVVYAPLLWFSWCESLGDDATFEYQNMPGWLKVIAWLSAGLTFIGTLKDLATWV